MDHKRRGSLVNTPDHQSKQMTVPLGTLPVFSLDDFGETSNYLEANDSSTTNSTCSFDAPPDVPPIPPRIGNSRRTRMAANERLLIIDTDVNIDAAPIPAHVAIPPPSVNNTNNTTPVGTAAKNNFEKSFVSNVNSLNIQKSNNGVNRAARPPLIDPPPKTINHKVNMTNATETLEVRRILSKMWDLVTYTHICGGPFWKDNGHRMA